MSNYLAVATTTAAIRYVLQEAVADLGANVTTQRPDAPSEPTVARANVYLYQTSPNAQFRNQDLPTRDAAGRLLRRPVDAVDLHYLVTFYGEEAALMPQRLMGRALARLHAEAVLTRPLIDAAIQAETSVDLSASDLAAQPVLVRFGSRPLSVDELNRLWSIFTHGHYNLSLALDASPLLLDEAWPPVVQVPVSAPRVRLGLWQAPVVTRVVAPAAPPEPLVIEGRRLLVPDPRIRLLQAAGETILGPQSFALQEERAVVRADALEGLRFGSLTVQVLGSSAGDGTVPQRSNLGGALVRPALERLACVESRVEATAARLVDPAQSVHLLLRSLAAPDVFYRLAAPVRAQPTPALGFDATGVLPGDYLAFLEVDGAQGTLDSPVHTLTVPAGTSA